MTRQLSPAYVLWFGPTGLSTARSLGRQGVPVKALHDDANEPCLDTRFAEPVILPDILTNEAAWLEWLLDEGRGIAPKRGVLIPASDATLLFVARHRAELEPFYRFAVQSHGDAEQWIGKPFQYAAAARAAVPFPATCTATTRNEVVEAARRFEFPCLVKPVLSHLWQKAYGNKLAFARTPDELLSHANSALERGLEIMIQECIPAADNEIYGLFLCVDHNSDPLGYCVARKLRQHEPRFGNSCMSQCVDEQRVVELGLRLIKEMGYNGIGSAEFKRDPRDGEFKLMEFNLRPTTMMGLAEDSGVNLPWLLYQHLGGVVTDDDAKDAAGPPKPVTPKRFGKRVGIFAQDVRVAKYLRTVGEFSWWRWARSWLGARDLYFAWDDVRPMKGYVRTFVDHLCHGRYRQFPPNFLSPEQWHASSWDGKRHPFPPEKVQNSRQTTGAAA